MVRMSLNNDPEVTMQTNIHPTTGVRYAIYHINNDLHPDIWDMIYAYGGEDLNMLEARGEALRKAEDALRDLGFSKWAVERCLDTLHEDFNEHYENDEPIYEGKSAGVKWRVTWLGGAPHLWVFESPFFAVGHECSPCVPGALDGGSQVGIFHDLATAEANARANGLVVGYSVLPSWLRDADQ